MRRLVAQASFSAMALFSGSTVKAYLDDIQVRERQQARSSFGSAIGGGGVHAREVGDRVLMATVDLGLASQACQLGVQCLVHLGRRAAVKVATAANEEGVTSEDTVW